jgi:hypothetical protein
MPSEANTAGAPAQGADATEPQGGASQAHGAEAQQPDAGSADNGTGTVDVASIQRKLSELERDNAKYRQEAREREDAQRKTDEAKLSDAERQQKRLTELTTENADLLQQLRDVRTRYSVIAAAQRLGFADPGDAFRLLDQSQLEFDDKGEPRHLDRLLGELLRAKPYLGNGTTRSAGSAEGGTRGGGQAQSGRNWLSEAMAARRGG